MVFTEIFVYLWLFLLWLQTRLHNLSSKYSGTSQLGVWLYPTRPVAVTIVTSDVHHAVSNHRQLYFLFNSLFWLTAKKILSLRINWSFVSKFHRWPMDPLHERSVMRKSFPFHHHHHHHHHNHNHHPHSHHHRRRCRHHHFIMAPERRLMLLTRLFNSISIMSFTILLATIHLHFSSEKTVLSGRWIPLEGPARIHRGLEPEQNSCTICCGFTDFNSSPGSLWY